MKNLNRDEIKEIQGGRDRHDLPTDGIEEYYCKQCNTNTSASKGTHPVFCDNCGKVLVY